MRESDQELREKVPHTKHLDGLPWTVVRLRIRCLARAIAELMADSSDHSAANNAEPLAERLLELVRSIGTKRRVTLRNAKKTENSV